MDGQDDRYAVYLRNAGERTESVEDAERAVATLPSYEDARRVCQWYQQTGRDCVIRFLGESGGGD
jgi:hypothetical protein